MCLRQRSFRWGSYTEAGTTGCDGAARSSEGYEHVDADLFLKEWRSEYLMIDSCGIKKRAPPNGPPAGYPGGQARWEMSLWNQILTDFKNQTGTSVVLHDWYVRWICLLFVIDVFNHAPHVINIVLPNHKLALVRKSCIFKR